MVDPEALAEYEAKLQKLPEVAELIERCWKPKKHRRPPHFETKDDTRNSWITILLAYLATDAAFMAKVELLRQEYPIVKGEPMTSIASLAASTARLSESEEPRRQARRYCERLLALLEEYGLNPDWAFELIHEAVADPGSIVRLTGFDLATFEQAREYTISWNAEDYPTKQSAKRHVLRQFETQWAECEGELKKAGFVKTRVKGAILEHVRWAYEHVCQRKSWRSIEREEHRNRDTIRKAALPVINLLGLRPPDLKGGRPRK